MPWRGQWIEAVLHTDRDLLIGDVTLGEVFSAEGLIARAHRPRRPLPKNPSTARITITRMMIARMLMVRSLPRLGRRRWSKRRRARAPIRPRAPGGEPWPRKPGFSLLAYPFQQPGRVNGWCSFLDSLPSCDGPHLGSVMAVDEVVEQGG
jgi:hypothetical protein